MKVWGSTMGCENGMGNSLGGVKHSGPLLHDFPGDCATRGATPRSRDITLHSSLATPQDPPVCALAQPLMSSSPLVGLASSPWLAAWSCHHSQRVSNSTLLSSFFASSWRTLNCYCVSWKILRWKPSENDNNQRNLRETGRQTVELSEITNERWNWKKPPRWTAFLARFLRNLYRTRYWTSNNLRWDKSFRTGPTVGAKCSCQKFKHLLAYPLTVERGSSRLLLLLWRFPATQRKMARSRPFALWRSSQ